MSLLNQVAKTLAWKKSNEYCAEKLGISIEEYKKLKAQVLSSHLDTKSYEVSRKVGVTEVRSDLDKGTAQIKGFAVCEPRTPEEIIELLKIDTSKWRLSNYWNKESGDRWVVSALVTRKTEEEIDPMVEVLENFKPKKIKVNETSYVNKKFDRNSVGILSLQDLHFGKENNSDVTEKFKETVINLTTRAYMSHKMDEIIYIIGGDLLNMDGFNGATTSGTFVDNDLRAQDAYTEAFEALHWSIQYIKHFCNTLRVVYIPGNHDRLSSYHMAHALSKCFYEEDNILFDVKYSERKVVVYGANFFGFEHGDVTKKNTPLVYATEFPHEWGSTAYRTCYTGHFHSKKTSEYVTENEYNGFSIKHLPSLSNTDYWHYHNKYVGSKRQGVLEVHDYQLGKVSEFSHNVQ